MSAANARVTPHKRLLVQGILVVSTLVCSWAFSLSAQEEHVESKRVRELVRASAEKLLDSCLESDRAWGMHIAGAHGIRTAAGKIVGILGSKTKRGKESTAQAEATDATTALALNALIRLHADVPAKVLLELDEKFVAQVLTLLLRDAARNESALIRVLQRHEDSVHVTAAVCNALLPARPPALFRALAERLTVVRRIEVLDDDSMFVQHACRSYPAFRMSVPSRFPTTRYHFISLVPSRGCSLLSPGPANVFSREIRIQPAHTMRSRWRQGADWHRYWRECNQRLRFEYLCVLAGMEPPGPVIEQAKPVWFNWTNLAALENRVEEERQRTRSRVDALNRALEKRGLAEGAMRPLLDSAKVKILLSDRRGDRSIPLPAID